VGKNSTDTDRAAIERRREPSVSVIVPILDEAKILPRALQRLGELRGVHEVIVVDGGSRDRGPDIAAAWPGVTLLRAARGRALQANAGAHRASGDVLLFLHADVALPTDAVEWVAWALREEAVVAGAFRTWTEADGETRPFWSPLLHLADMRSRYSGLPYGDQAMFVRREVFHTVGGFPELPLMEDLELSRRLRRAGRVATVPASVRVSGRRFVARPIFYLVVVNLFPLLYRLGVSPAILSRMYGPIR
jgi:rSAM/selenodomain-associated transferase 2